MPDAQIFNKSKEVIGETQLPEVIFGEKPKKHLLYDSVRLQLANKRCGTASVKSRSEIAGSTRKLFRQKGTGRSRVGSKKSPTRIGGGVAFGPHPRDYGFKLSKKVRRRALISALVLKSEEGNLILLDNLEIDSHKTAQTVNLLKQFEADKSCLLVVNETRNNLKRGSRNIPDVKAIHVDGLNVYDILNHKKLMIEKDALEKLERRFSEE